MGNFFVNLGKGFVRSAVNQVGRDGGKVISNSIYGNAHATPIRGVNMNQKKQYINETTEEIITPEELRKRGELEGMCVKIHKYPLATKITWFVSALLFSWTFIPEIVLFIKGIQKFVQRHVYMEKRVTIANYTTDKRYKSGQRLQGYSSDTIRLKVPILPHEKVILIRTGVFYILLSFVIGYTGTAIIRSLNESTQARQYEQFLDRAQSEKDLIQLYFETTNDSAKYKKQMEEFNKQLEEATNYINNKKNK
ncbi:MAG: hypothetical protein ACK5ND_05775 [Bacteroides sp.]